uniref:Uncharacterized protein n=1 Tax=Musa acuminata subsp. malaccensis TaxID=214687 RepID=A0A804IGQ8_MUSAM
MKAAAVAKVDHFILLTSLGTKKIGFPVAVLKCLHFSLLMLMVSVTNNYFDQSSSH